MKSVLRNKMTNHQKIVVDAVRPRINNMLLAGNPFLRVEKWVHVAKELLKDKSQHKMNQ